MNMKKLGLAAATLTIAAGLLLTGCASNTPTQTGEVPADSAPQQTSGKWETFDVALSSWMDLYAKRDFTEACKHVSNVGMAELVPGYGSTCEKALEYKQSQPYVKYIGDPQYADWSIADGNIADEDTMRAAGEVRVDSFKAGLGQDYADSTGKEWWVVFENGWEQGSRATFTYDANEGWVIVDVS